MADEVMQVDRHGILLDEAYGHFLVSAEASIVNGAVLVADGGAMIVDLPTLALGRDRRAYFIKERNSWGSRQGTKVVRAKNC